MSSFIKFLPLAAVLALASPAISQEQPATDTLNLGEAVQETVITPYVAEANGDWELQCIKLPDVEKDPCQMYQLLKDEADNPTAEINLFKIDDGSQAVAGARVTVPLETLLTAQLTISVDGEQAKRYPFSFCNAVGCIAQIGLTAQDIEGYQKGSEAVVTIVPAAAPKEVVKLKLSLSGFTKSFAGVSVAN